MVEEEEEEGKNKLLRPLEARGQKRLAHGYVILVEYQLDRMNIAESLSIGHFCASPLFYHSCLKHFLVM